MMEKETAEITIDVRASVSAHIQSLQDTITKRNERIEELEKELEELKNDPSGLLERYRIQSFKDGYKACSERIKGRMEEIVHVLNYVE